MKLQDLPLASDYKLTDGEIDNIVYVVCKYTVGWQMRKADLQVCRSMLGDKLRGAEALHKLVQVTCEYVWDHIAGEPDNTSPEALYEHIAPAIAEWWKETTPEQRDSTA